MMLLVTSIFKTARGLGENDYRDRQAIRVAEAIKDNFVIFRAI